MIRNTLTTNVAPLNNAIVFLDNIDKEIAAIGDAVLQEIKPELLDELRDKPPKRSYPGDYPIEWTSDKQRRAFFASDGFGGGIPTTRTDSIINSWEVFGKSDGANYSIVTQNTNPASRFVVGSLAKDVTRAARFQQKFHAITGWKLATIAVQEWTGIAQQLFAEQVQLRFRNAISKSTGRAFTSPRNR